MSRLCFDAIAVHLLRVGADVQHVRLFLGHSDIETTRRYLKVFPGFLAEVYHRHMPQIAVRVAGMGPASSPLADVPSGHDPPTRANP